MVVVGIPSLAEDERLTIEWIFSEDGKNGVSAPDYTWTDSGVALLYDKRRSMEERTIESFDPETGKRQDLVDPTKVLESLTALLEPEEALEEIGWPDAFHPQGLWAAYTKDDRVILLDLESAEVVALGGGSGEEKSPRFSPDGRALAFVRDNDLFVWDLESREERRLTEDGSSTLLNGTVSWVYWEEIFGRNDLGYWWSPDSTSIAYLQTDESGVSLMSYVDFKPSVPRVIHQRYPKTGGANPRVRAGVLDLESGKTTWIDLGVYPYEYLVRVKWLPDGERVAVQTLDRPQTTLDLFFADASTGEVTHVLRETDDGWVNLHDDLYFVDGGARFIWESERDGFAHLYLYEANGELVRQVTRGEWAVRASGGVFWLRQAVSHIDEQNGWIYFTALKESSIEKQLYRVRLDGSGPERISEEVGTHRILFRSDGKYYLDGYSAIDTPPSLTLRRPNGKSISTVSPSRPESVENFDLLPRELFTIKTGDGFEMPVMMLKPRGFNPKTRYPVVIYVYGGPSAPTVSNAWQGRARSYFDQLLADEGFVVLYVDNRSATAISKRLENLIAREGYGATELTDLLDAVKWLKGQPFVDPERVGIWGWSGGGSFTLLALTSSKEFRAGVAVAAVSDWHYYDSVWAEAFMKRPSDNPEGYKKTSHAERAESLHGRLLLVHGTYDDNVHPQNAWRFADELIEAGITFDMMIYPMRKHGIRDDAAQRHLYTTMLEFWRRNLKNVEPDQVP
jgi:dipeptidyl-peptidase-4